MITFYAADHTTAKVFDISTAQYQEGLVPYDTVINTLSAHLQQQNQLAVTRGDVATSLVQVYKALGGGWEIREDRDPVDFLPTEMKDEMRNRTKLWQGTLQ